MWRRDATFQQSPSDIQTLAVAGKGLLISIESISISLKSIDVTVFPRLNHCTTRSTDRIRDIAAIKSHALISDTIKIGCRDSRRVIGTNRLLAMIIGKDEDNIGLLHQHQRRWLTPIKPEQPIKKKYVEPPWIPLVNQTPGSTNTFGYPLFCVL